MADPHVGHPLMSRLRGFSSVDEHDHRILANLRIMDTEDCFYILGDLAFGLDKFRLLGQLAAVTYETHVILGNHDRPHPMNRNYADHLAGWNRIFSSVSVAGSLRHEGHTVLLSHFPYDGEGSHHEGDDRASQWRLRDEGRLLFHGHTHEKTQRSESALGTPMVHVGADAWGLGPVRLEEAFELFGVGS